MSSGACTSPYVKDTFFEPAFLQKQLSQKLGSLISAEQIEKALLGMLEAPEFDAAINQKLQEISSTPMGTMIKMAGITVRRWCRLTPGLKATRSNHVPGPWLESNRFSKFDCEK